MMIDDDDYDFVVVVLVTEIICLFVVQNSDRRLLI
jgi:hypothetical protein